MLDEIRDGLRLVAARPGPAGVRGAQMLMATLWGVFGATWFLFALDELGARPGGASGSSPGSAARRRSSARSSRPGSTRRWGVGPVAIAAMLLAALGNLFIPLAPAGLPLVAIALPASASSSSRDSAVTVYDVTETSVRQSLVARPRARAGRLDVPGRRRRRPSWSATIGAGLLAEVIGLRATAFLAPLGGLLGGGDPVLVAGPARCATCPSMDDAIARPRSSSRSSAISRSAA